MSGSNISQCGFKQSEASVTPASPVIWTSGQTWDGLIVEKRFAGKSAPELNFRENSLLIRLSSVPNGRNKNYDDGRAVVDLCYFSIGASAHPCQHQRSRPQDNTLFLILAPETNRRAARALGVDPNHLLPELHQFRDAQIEHLGMALESEAESGYLSGRLYGESLGVALAVHLLSKYALSKPVGCGFKGGMTPTNLRRVIEYIDENLTEDIALSRLAKVANLSQFRFAHNFKKATGLSPHQYVIRERLERAEKMLRETDLSVTTIAYAVGCGSPSRFTLLFRRANGVIPSVYRTSYR